MSDTKKALFVALIIVGVTFSSTFVFVLFSGFDNSNTYTVDSFSSYGEMQSYLAENYGKSVNDDYFNYFSNGWAPRDQMVLETADSESGGSKSSNYGGSETSDYSETNVQVVGVDEPDIVKTDGSYIYVLIDKTIYIIKASPASESVILSEITLDSDDAYPQNIFINDDTLVVFCSSYYYPILYSEPILEDGGEDAEVIEDADWWGVSSSSINIYDISDRENPQLSKEIEIEGTYFDSRMINDYVYFIATENTYDFYRVYDDYESFRVPEMTVDNSSKKLDYSDIYYVQCPQVIDTMTHIIAINLNDLSYNEKSFLLSSSWAHTVYVSTGNIYLTSTEYSYSKQGLFDIYGSSEENTIIHKISINNAEIEYVGYGSVPGRILNQFSMDEHNGYFRIATTIGYSWDESSPSKNNVYILDSELNRASSLENIAPGEQIYSSRFMGDKAYLVTFKNTDPFFTLDLSDPNNPKILGELKIPGYSDYLHPYDENHIIGIGKDSIEASPDFAWYQGVKIALFDVTDFENPKEVSKVIIGDRGTDSPALYDHKAFLFDKEKELLVVPISLYEIDEETKNYYYEESPSMYGSFKFQGAYVYKLNQDGFTYRGNITHMTESEMSEKDTYWRWYDSNSYITRSLYIDEVLYTISNKMIKMNELYDLNEINSVEFE